MPIELDNDLSIDLREQEIEIPVNSSNRKLGTVRITVRDLPYAIEQSLRLQRISYSQALGKISHLWGKLKDSEPLSSSEAESFAVAYAQARKTQVEIARWGVVSHREEDFLLRGKPTPHISVDRKIGNESYKVTSQSTLHYYELASGTSVFTISTSLLSRIENAVMNFSAGKIETPEEIWAEHEKSDKESEEKTKSEEDKKKETHPIATGTEILTSPQDAPLKSDSLTESF